MKKMSENLTIYEAGQTLSRAKGENYVVTAPFTGQQTTLKRDVDFGVVPGTKQPSLYKAGAQKIANAFGLLQHYTVESAIENPETPVFFYRVRCDLVKIAQDGTEYVFTSGHGSANTMEKRNGRNSAWDSANATLKMAEKRALTAAVIAIAGLADAFTQDMEAEDFVNREVQMDNPDDVITAKQRKYLFAVGSSVKLSTTDVKNIIESFGYSSTTQIKKSDFDRIVEAVREKENINA
jgi:hypothetical protein